MWRPTTDAGIMHKADPTISTRLPLLGVEAKPGGSFR
jgi:hypothetical protein